MANGVLMLAVSNEDTATLRREAARAGYLRTYRGETMGNISAWIRELAKRIRREEQEKADGE